MGNNQSPKLLKEFKSLIESQDLPESKYQQFLEEHTEFLIRPFLLNHGLHFDAIISQFRLNTDLTADFCYLTKSSVGWWVVLVELEPPGVPLFLKDKLQLTPSAEFSKRLAQIQTWKGAVEENPPEIVAQLDVIRKPLQQNRVSFKYVLIVGRDASQRREEFANRIRQLNGSDIRILTFDSLVRHYENGHGRTCNIISLRKGKVRFKHLNVLPESMLAYVSPTDLLLQEADKRKLRRWGISVKDWEACIPMSVKQKMKHLRLSKARLATRK